MVFVESSKMKIWVNTLVYNEENFLWYAVKSVIDYVDKILIWDTGSTDSTVSVIEALCSEHPGKISFREVGVSDKHKFRELRQQMLDESHCDWILILDGDEVWWDKSIKNVTDVIRKKGDSLDAIVVPFYTLVGDVYHYQEDLAGKYKILGKTGHLSIRALNCKIPGLHIENPYGSEGFFDGSGKVVHERDSQRILLMQAPYLHFTHLKRSSKPRGQEKFKYDLGLAFTKGFAYPEVLSKTAPKFIPPVWKRRGLSYEAIGLLKAPFVYIWRRIR